MPVPNTFASATSAIPLANLDANFATPITLGNTAVQLGNTITTINNVTITGSTLTTANVASGNVANSITLGTTAGDNASAGYVGEVISSLTTGGGTPTSGTIINVTSISLTAGDWDVYGGVGFNIAGGSVVSQVQASLSTTSATISLYTSGSCTLFNGTIGTGTAFSSPVPSIRVNVSTTTTVYLCANNSFTGTATTIGGNIYARRRR